MRITKIKLTLLFLVTFIFTEVFSQKFLIDTRKDSIITFESLSNGLITSKDILHIENSKINQNEILITTHKGMVYKYTDTAFKEIFQPQNNHSKVLYFESTEDESYWKLEKGVFVPFLVEKDSLSDLSTVEPERADISYLNNPEKLSIQDYNEKPLFYFETWFLLLLGLGFIGLAYAYYFNWKVKKFRKTEQILEWEVKNRIQQIEKDKEIILAQTEELKTLDKTKTQFFANITHEFRTPLTLIIGPLEQIMAGEIPFSLRKKLFSITENARHLMALINQFLDMSKLENGGMKTEANHGNIVIYTKELIERFRPAAAKKELNLIFNSEEVPWETVFDKNKWNKIIYNLISNAIKFTPKGGSIETRLFKTKNNKKQFIQLIIRDTGIGIEKENLEHIFNRFYHIDNSMTRMQEGTGIGLSLVKELVESQNGEISVKSELGKGTEFKILLPVLEDELFFADTMEKYEPSNPIIAPINSIEKKVTKNGLSLEKMDKKLNLLIVDDNDELRAYICSCFEENLYKISEAVDGEEGIKKAMTEMPDLIISDVIMPKKNGFDLLSEVRANFSTSHIPVILLTAKASLNSRLAGLEGGADAYLTKPFSPQELVLRAQKLIESRRKLQKRYSNVSEPLFEKEETTIKEDEFITNLRNYIINNLDNTNLNGELISKQFYITRVHLYRKLKAQTGQSISEYVKTIRLQKSVELLAEKKWRVTEIADKVGFSSISHFSRVFKKEFGKSPTKFD